MTLWKDCGRASTHDYCDSEISAMKGTGNWYYFDTVFRRHQVDQTRFGSLFWVPSLGLFATIVGSWGVWGLGKRRKSDFHIRLAEGLTLYLASVLFAFPFILSITQYGPGQITPPEWLFYIDAVLAFASALISLYLEYRWQSARKNDRPSLEEP